MLGTLGANVMSQTEIENLANVEVRRAHKGVQPSEVGVKRVWEPHEMSRFYNDVAFLQ